MGSASASVAVSASAHTLSSNAPSARAAVIRRHGAGSRSACNNGSTAGQCRRRPRPCAAIQRNRQSLPHRTSIKRPAARASPPAIIARSASRRTPWSGSSHNWTARSSAPGWLNAPSVLTTANRTSRSGSLHSGLQSRYYLIEAAACRLVISQRDQHVPTHPRIVQKRQPHFKGFGLPQHSASRLPSLRLGQPVATRCKHPRDLGQQFGGAEGFCDIAIDGVQFFGYQLVQAFELWR